MSDASPVRWHLAHTTWFFETFVLAKIPEYEPSQTEYAYLFNSYYNAIGKQFPRERRGLLSRPTVAQVWEYRREIDRHLTNLLTDDRFEKNSELATVIELGLHHEQQHQELILTDIKHALSCNPMYPTYRAGNFSKEVPPAEGWTRFPEGIYWIGHDGDEFAFDNESPRHRTFLESFAISNRLVTCGEFLEFIDDGGYRRPELWLSEGWRFAVDQHWECPLYWLQREGAWHEFTLSGVRPLGLQQPVCHVSYFEAEAFARWAGARLPTEAEWEAASEQVPISAKWADALLSTGAAIHPPGETPDATLPLQMFARCGNGRPARTLLIPDIRPHQGRWGNTMANSCATSSFCAEVPAPPRRTTFGAPIATFFHRESAGNSLAFGWRNDRRPSARDYQSRLYEMFGCLLPAGSRLVDSPCNSFRYAWTN